MRIDVLKSISTSDGDAPRVGLTVSTDRNRGPTNHTNSPFLERPFESSPLSSGPTAAVEPLSQKT